MIYVLEVLAAKFVISKVLKELKAYDDILTILYLLQAMCGDWKRMLAKETNNNMIKEKKKLKIVEITYKYVTLIEAFWFHLQVDIEQLAKNKDLSDFLRN